MTCLPLGLISNHLPLPSLSQPHCLPRVCLTSEVSFCFRAFVFAATSQAPSSFLCKLCSNVTSQRGLPRQPHLKKKKNTFCSYSCPLTVCPFILLFFLALNNTADDIYLFVCLSTRMSTTWGSQFYSVLFTAVSTASKQRMGPSRCLINIALFLMHEEMNTTKHSSWDIVNGYEFVMSILEIKKIFNGKTEILQ